jgi:hypothetical protein
MASKTIRIIAFSAVNQKTHMRTVNVFNTAPARNEFPTYLQAAAGPLAHEYPTYMASGAANPTNTQGLPNIFVSGYSGPS